MDLKNRARIINHLRQNNAKLTQSVLYECQDAIYQSYEQSSRIRRLSVACPVREHFENYQWKSIGIRQHINLFEFNDPSYIWLPYFSDVARAVSHGEQLYLQDLLKQQITPIADCIKNKEPDFDLLLRRTSALLDDGIKLDTILAPVYMLTAIYKQLGDLLIFEVGEKEKLVIDHSRFNLFWSNKYAPLDSFIIFDSSAGRWTYAEDQESHRPLTVAIGESPSNPGTVEYWVETLCQYSISNPAAFIQIPVLTDENKEAET